MFSVYLARIVEEFTGVPIEDEFLPEFPLKRDLIWPEPQTDKSVKVDYVLFAKDRSRVVFVELKTDSGSRREAQDDYLNRAKELGFRKIVEGVRSIVLKTNAHQKYHHLTFALARLGYLTLPADLKGFIHPEPRRGLVERLEKIAVTPLESKIDVIYLQPHATAGDTCIDFERVAAHVSKHSDPFSKRFAEHLLAWRLTAGAREPT